MSYEWNIQEVDGHYVISSYGCWVTGVYEDLRAAKLAEQFCCDLQSDLRDEAVTSNDGIITYDAMLNMQKERGLSCGEGAHREGWKKGDPLVFSAKRQTERDVLYERLDREAEERRNKQ